MKAVLFDLFGTLVDNATVAQVEGLHHTIADILGVPRTEFADGWRATFHDRSRGVHGSIADSIRAAAELCSARYDESALGGAVEIRTEFVRGWLTPRPDAIETLMQLRMRGLKIGLLSNCTADVPILWQTHEFAPLFDEPLFSCEEGLRKPMPEFYDRALRRLGFAAAECLYVADGDNGELAQAKVLGMPVVMIRPAGLLNDYRVFPEEDWDGPRIERLGELLHSELLL
ncbi:MAG: HAD-IA family hydrolase [Bacteroidota bacterium]|nr:HAD-IA family hydrolase [Bacteroidota bacterium]MDP4233488.1 HAD-IA family hydrolase [Bacteroidota bacterium]MDP4243366.1 HAD-IA family hydrolase [Bacteroidota bacterium]MDP4287948.1 HAD-IA family hydrolase [Bacteroidota bacterium]